MYGLVSTLIYGLYNIFTSADDSDVVLDMARLNAVSQNLKQVLSYPPKPMVGHKDRMLTAKDIGSDVGGLDSFMFMRSCPVVQDRLTTSSIEPINGQ